MTTPRQQEANRRNAGRSTGPVTPEGRAASSRNAIRHGVLSSDIVVASGENRSEFDSLLQALRMELQPQSLVEATLVEQLAVLIWRNRRLADAERVMMEGRVAWSGTTPALAKRAIDPRSPEDYRLLLESQKVLPLPTQLLIGRYQIMITNQMLGIIETLRELGKGRDASTAPGNLLRRRRPVTD